MKYLVRGFGVLMFLTVLLGMTACDGETPGDVDVSLLAVVDTTSRSARSESDEASRNITPSSYKIALTYFALERDDGTIVPLINETEPIVYDFSGHVISPPLLLGTKKIPTGTYTGYEMRFTYLEMDLMASFNVPTWSTDTSHVLVTGTHDGSGNIVHQNATLRQYFNASGKFHKRDMVVDIGTTDSEWAWMRRELEDSDGNRKFFLTTETHPAVGCIDLFDDVAFWGSSDNYDDPDVKITIRSGETTGGLDATMDVLTISATASILLTVNIADSFNFYENLLDTTYGQNQDLDFGPTTGGVSTTYYGDKGFHPKMPAFHLKKR